MHYFISTREDVNTSAIELAQIKRLEIFDSLNLPVKIVEIEKNDFIEETRKQLKTTGRVINIFQFFQNLPEKRNVETKKLLKNILEKDELTVKNNVAFLDDKPVIKAYLYQDRLYYVDYLDKYGFTLKREFYRYNNLDYTEYFDDQAHLMIREFVDNQKQPIIREYFCQSNQNTPLLTFIELNQKQQHKLFYGLADFQAYFLDNLVREDPSSVFYCDRSTQVLPAIDKMQKRVPTFVVLHSALTPSGDINEPLYSVYKPIKSLLQSGKVKAIISSTKKEADDVKTIFNTKDSYAIPVTYIHSKQPAAFSNRRFAKIIAVARIDTIKQLGHLIKAVIKVHKNCPQVTLEIYGNNTDQVEAKRLTELVQQNNAGSFIKFCGFAKNLEQVYSTAQLEVLTSKNEGFAMALLEAQSYGCPALSYDINYGPSDIIDKGKSGELVKANDQEALYEAMLNLLTDQDLLAKYSIGAYQHSQLFDFDHLRKKWNEFLNEQINV